MPAAKEEKNLWKLFMEKFRDVVFIILFIATSIGWVELQLLIKQKQKWF